MKKTLALAATATLALTLAGCGGATSETKDTAANDSNSWRVAYLKDPRTGKEVRCAVNDYSNRSGVSCDWSAR